MELEVTWGRAARVWFAFLWRNLFAIVGGVILGGIIGFLVGFLAQLTGLEPEVGQRITMVLGVVIGLGVSVVPIRMILGKDFGEFRLVLLSSERAPADRLG